MGKFILRAVGWLIAVNVLLVEPSFASKFTPVLVSVNEKFHANDLKWNQEFCRVRIEDSGAGLQTSIQLFGTYPRDQWKLRYRSREISRNDRGGFRIELPIDQDHRIFEFTVEGPNGEIEKEQIEINADVAQIKTEYGIASGKTPQEKVIPEKKWFLVPGVGVSMITAKQTNVEDYKTTAISGKVSLNHRLVPQKWDLGLSTFFTVAQLSKSSDVNVRYLGLNFRVGYLVPNLSTDWFLSIYGGWYYTTTFNDSQEFGYANLSGPQIYPSIKKVLPNGDVVSVYFKYSPVSSSFNLLKLSNREIAGGLSYIRLLPDDHSIGASFDISNISLTIDDIVTQTNSLTLGIQYGL
jgi:hypothetical protein